MYKGEISGFKKDRHEDLLKIINHIKTIKQELMSTRI
jgi:hypothetical protein